MDIQEEKLKGGQSGKEVTRIGDTVHREQNANSPFIHKLLLLLKKQDFQYSPSFLGIDDNGREIISYIEGEVPHDETNLSEETIEQAMRILKIFHDATSSSELSGDSEVICHNDFSPWNIVVNDDKVVGMIDFDGATLGRRVDDVTYSLWTFLELGNDDTKTNEYIQMIKRLLDVYGDFQKEDFVEVLLNHQKQTLVMRKEKSENAPTEEARLFSKERAKRIKRQIQWTIDNAEAIKKSLGIN